MFEVFQFNYIMKFMYENGWTPEMSPTALARRPWNQCERLNPQHLAPPAVKKMQGNINRWLQPIPTIWVYRIFTLHSIHTNNTLHCIVLRFITLHCVAVHFITMRCIALRCISLQYIALPYMPYQTIPYHIFPYHYMSIIT